MVKTTQLIPPDLLAWIVISLRTASGWSQETLAELSGINVRSVQRVEKGEPSSIDTRRALAKGFKYDDLDVFNLAETGQQFAKFRADLIREVEETRRKQEFPDCMFVKAAEIHTGKGVGEFALSLDAWASDMNDDAPKDVQEIYCELMDYVSEFAEVKDLYDQSGRLKLYEEFDQRCKALAERGFSVYCGSARMQSTQPSASGEKIKWVVGYYRLMKSGCENVEFAMPKTTTMGF